MNVKEFEKIKKSNKIYIQMEPPDGLKGHPIIAGPNSPTKRLSSLLEKILSPLVPKLSIFTFQYSIPYLGKINWEVLL